LRSRWFPQAVGRDAQGYLGEGEVDQGFMDIDDLEFFRSES
jgi:hypothetical protein